MKDTYYIYDIEYVYLYFAYELCIYKCTITYEGTTAYKELVFSDIYETYADAMFALIYLDKQFGNIIDE